jgi:hypothetical protein
MGFSLAALLIHSQMVPEAARDALRAATTAPAELRMQSLESAARVLHREAGIDCRDAREVVGLNGHGGCR